jgi:hypothetical protein
MGLLEAQVLQEPVQVLYLDALGVSRWVVGHT